MHSQHEWTHSNIKAFGAIQFRVHKVLQKKNFSDFDYLIQCSSEDQLS